MTGTIGDGGATRCIEIKRGVFLIRRYRLPEPRVAFGQRLRGVATAAIDVSDGLLADLGHIADVSKVRVVVELSRVPLSNRYKTMGRTKPSRSRRRLETTMRSRLPRLPADAKSPQGCQ